MIILITDYFTGTVNEIIIPCVGAVVVDRITQDHPRDALDKRVHGVIVFTYYIIKFITLL